MKVSFEGIGERVVTFYNTRTAGKAAEAGAPVAMSGSGEVCACAAGERFMGFALAADEDFAAVQTAGYVKAPYSGDAPAPGYVHLAAGADGTVTKNEAGGDYLVLDTDTAANTVGFIL